MQAAKERYCAASFFWHRIGEKSFATMFQLQFSLCCKNGVFQTANLIVFCPVGFWLAEICIYPYEAAIQLYRQAYLVSTLACARMQLKDSSPRDLGGKKLWQAEWLVLMLQRRWGQHLGLPGFGVGLSVHFSLRCWLTWQLTRY